MSLAPLVLLSMVSAAEPDTAVSLQLGAFLASGVDVQVERYLPDPRFSVALSLGLRPQATEDFRGLNASLGFEARRYLWAPFLGRVDGVERGGLFALVRLDTAYTQLATRDGRAVGNGFRLTPSAGIGYRLIPVWRLELTPAVSGGAETQVDLGATSRPRVRAVVTYGLTAGVVF